MIVVVVIVFEKSCWLLATSCKLHSLIRSCNHALVIANEVKQSAEALSYFPKEE